MTFAQPHWFWALGLLPLLAALFILGERKRRAALRWLIAARLESRLAGSVSRGKRVATFLLLCAAIALAVTALARPQAGFTWDEKKETGRDVIIAVDTSRSMLAADLQPGRLARAKLASQDLLTHLVGDRVGVIAFAGSAFLQAPLTGDFTAVRDTLAELDTEIIPRGGTNLTEAIAAAADAFGKGESEHRALIIFTDGEELEDDAVKSARDHKDKFRTFTIGLGSADGALIPVPTQRGGTQFVRDEAGNYVKSRLDEKRLREVAEAGGGFYIHLQNGPAEMKRIATEGIGTMKTATNEARFAKKPIERYQWPLAGAVACLLATFFLGGRRSTKAPLRATVAAILLLPASAAEKTPATLFAEGDYAGAAKGFEAAREKRAAAELDFNAGISAYKAGDFEKAATSLASALGTGAEPLQPKAAFHLANTLARRSAKLEKKEDKLSDLKNAVQHYDRTLALDPAHPDAAHNRDLVKRLIEQLEKKDEQQEQKKDEEKKDDEKKDEQEKNESQQGDKNEEKKDGEKKDGSQPGEGEKKEDEKQEGGGQQKQDGEKKDGEKTEGSQPGEGEKKDGEQKDGSKPGDEKKDGEKKPGEQQSGEKSDKPGEKPAEAPAQPQPGEKKQGDLRAAQQPGETKPGENAEAKEAAEAQAAAAEGRMTEKDAKQLLESMRNVERRVRLLDPRQEQTQQGKKRVIKDW